MAGPLNCLTYNIDATYLGKQWDSQDEGAMIVTYKALFEVLDVVPTFLLELVKETYKFSQEV